MDKRGILKQNSFTIRVIQKLLDISLIFLLLVLSKLAYGQNWNDPRVLTLAFCTIALFLFFANIFSLYRSWRVHSIWEEAQILSYVLLASVLCLLLMAYITKSTASFSRLAIGTWWFALPLCLFLLRLAVRSSLQAMRQDGFNTRVVAVAGSGEAAQKLVEEIQENVWMGLTVDGFYDNRKSFRKTNGEPSDYSSEVEIKGRFDDLVKGAREGKFDALYVALPMKAEALIMSLITKFSDSSVPVHIVPDVFTFNLLNSRTSNIGHIPIISIYESPLDEIGIILKRILDVVASLCILSIIALPMLLIALIIKLTSSGPVIFKQRRYGLKSDEITVWKFRSMVVTKDNEESIKQASKNDARVTAFGAFLRRTSLDELPQFINVLQGSMSIVGPRPHAIAHNELYRKSIEGYMLRHLVKPGITGWAQVNGWRGETDTDEKMEQRIAYDLAYLSNWSLMFDIKIIFMTIFKGFTNKNAY